MKSSAKEIRMRYNPGIDGLRAVAVLLVLAYHFWPSTFKAGFIGVDIFFVISGFVITRTITAEMLAGRFSLISFYRRRINRLYPGLIVVLVFTLTIGSLFLIRTERLELYKEVLSSALFVPNIYFYFNSNYFAVGDTYKPLLNMWSLGVEEQFYMFWPLLLIFATKRRVVIPMTLAVIVASIAAWCIASQINSTFAFYMPMTRAWQLLAGALIASLDWELRVRRLSTVLAIAGLLTLIVAYFLLSENVFRFPGVIAIPIVAATAAILLSTFGTSTLTSVLSNPGTVYIGKLSYLLYLFHWPALYFLNLISPSMPMKLMALAAIFVASSLVYHALETPVRGNNSLKVAGGLVALSALIVVISTVQYSRTTTSPIVANFTGNDFELTYRGSCAAVTAIYGDDLCNSNTTFDNADVVMLGDSYAGAYSNLLKYLAQDQQFGYYVAAQSQCPPVQGIGPENCVKLNKEMLEKALSSNKARTIILSADWPRYFNDEAVWSAKYPDTRARFPDQLRETIRIFKAAGKRVVFFYSPPDGAAPRDCVDRSRDDGAAADKNCNIVVDDKLKQQKAYRDSISWIEAAGALTYDPFAFLCDAKECKVSNPPFIFYVDHGHLSNFGAYYLYTQSRNELIHLLIDRNSGALH